VLRADGSKTFILPEDFKINADIEIFGKTISVYDCDQYTREFYEVYFSFIILASWSTITFILYSTTRLFWNKDYDKVCASKGHCNEGLSWT